MRKLYYFYDEFRRGILVGFTIKKENITNFIL